jgi:hypothetical protein
MAISAFLAAAPALAGDGAAVRHDDITADPDLARSGDRVAALSFVVAAADSVVGDIALALTEPGLARLGEPARPREPWAAGLQAALLRVDTRARIVVARPRATTVTLRALRVGDVLPIAAPRDAALIVGGQAVAHGAIEHHDGRAQFRIAALQGDAA